MLNKTEIAEDRVGLLEGLVTTRAIRRYRDEPVPEAALRDILFAATRAPSGSNRQPFRFIVLTDSEVASRAKTLIARGARSIWEGKRKPINTSEIRSDERLPKLEWQEPWMLMSIT